MFDPGFILTQVNDEDLTYGVEHAKYLIGNDYEISLIRQRVKNYDSFAKNKTIITTLGEDGALIEDQGNIITIKPAKAEKVVDPSGAGDAWRSGFLAGIEKSFDLKTCGQMGSISACYTVEQYGAQEYHYSTEEFTKRYNKTYNESLVL